MQHPRVHIAPCHVHAEGGEVVVDGEHGLVASLSAETAFELSDRLMRAGLEATGQELGMDRLDRS